MNKIRELPSGWMNTPLRTICAIYQGYGFPKELQGIAVDEFPFYKVGDISRNVKQGLKYLKSCENYISKAIMIKLKAIPCPINTIVFAKIGEGLKLNRRAIIKQPGLVDNNAIGLKANELLVYDLFLFYFLNTIKLEDYARATTVPSVRKSDIEEIFFPLPPLPEQHRIVAKLEELFSSLDKGIENLKIAQQQLKVYRQAVLKWAFEGKFTNENVKEGELPEGWKWVKLSDLAEAIDPQPSHRTPPIFPDGIPYVGIGDIDKDKNVFNFSKARKVSSSVLKEHIERYKIHTGDFVLGKIGTIGKPFRIPIERFYTLSANVVLVKPNPAICLSSFLFNISNSIVIEKQFKSGSNATTQAAFGIQKVRILEIPLPTLAEQQLIVSEIETRLSVCDKLEESINQSLQQADALRQSILKKAFEGKLVPQDPNDEPASVLLERIRAERAQQQPENKTGRMKKKTSTMKK